MKMKPVESVAQSSRDTLTTAQQEALILTPYVDFLMNDDIKGLFNLAQHAGISIRSSIAAAVLGHYRLGDGKYDVDRAAEDFASRPPPPEITYYSHGPIRS
jgi:hypothetical protein